MNWVTVIWSMGGGACLTLALMHLVVWWKDRTARANLVFSVMGIAVATFAALELALMRAETPEQFGVAVRWMHVPAWVIVASLIGFVRLYLKAGRRWLAWTVVAVRTLSLILNFAFSPNINYREITGLRHIPFLGESVSVATGVASRWTLIGQLSLLLLGIWVWDIVRDEIWISEKGRALFGFAPSEKLDIDRFRNAIHPDDRDSLLQAVQNSLSTGMEYDAEHRVLLPNGQVRWLNERGSVEFNSEGKPARMRGVSRDVTRRKLGEAALLESEVRFRTMANTAPVLIWMSGLDKLCTFFNKPWLEFTGRTIEQEMGNGWAEGVHADDLQRCLQIYTEAFDARQPFVMQYRLRRHDGEYRWISDNGVPRYDAQKNFAGYIGSCMDVTELINKEQALRESEERMSLAADAAGLIVWTWDIRRDEVTLSDKDRAFFGFSPREKLNGDRVRSVVHLEDRQFVRQLVENSLRTPEALA